MPQISISEPIYARLSAFKQVVQTVLEGPMNIDECAELVLTQGIDSMLADILGPLEQAILLHSIQQLGAQHPEHVYSFVAGTLRGGSATNERERLKHRFGFHPKTGE